MERYLSCTTPREGPEYLGIKLRNVAARGVYSPYRNFLSDKDQDKATAGKLTILSVIVYMGGIFITAVVQLQLQMAGYLGRSVPNVLVVNIYSANWWHCKYIICGN